MTAGKSGGRIAFQGELGANSHEACMAAFPDMEPVPNATFEEAFEAVRSGDCQLGMIPVENSIAGRVADVHHLLPSSGLKIIGERFKPIHFHLMANPGVKLEEIETAVFSVARVTPLLAIRLKLIGLNRSPMIFSPDDGKRWCTSPTRPAIEFSTGIMPRAQAPDFTPSKASSKVA